MEDAALLVFFVLPERNPGGGPSAPPISEALISFLGCTIAEVRGSSISKLFLEGSIIPCPSIIDKYFLESYSSQNFWARKMHVDITKSEAVTV